MDDAAAAVDNFTAITGASEAVASQLLDITNGDLSQAVTLYFDNPDAFNQPSASAAHPAATQILPPLEARPARRNSPRAPAGRQDHRGVIHIDSDDDDDVHMLDDDLDAGFGVDEGGAAAVAATVARTAQEEEDAAMAKRLQEELYAENAGTSDGIRAPMGRTTETLVAPSYGMAAEEDDIDGAIMDQLRRRRQPRRKNWSPRASCRHVY